MTTPIPPDARALTIRQPWASLIALGVKTIETRGWRTDYRGPVVIHAGAKEPERGRVGRFTVDCFTTGHDFYLKGDDGLTVPLPLGAVVAVVDLVDVVPIVDRVPDVSGPTTRHVHIRNGTTFDLTLAEPVEVHYDGSPSRTFWVWNPKNITGQLPYGDFTPGRYAWLLDNVRSVDPPVPAKGRQGLWRWNP